jgi:hypothetical protein
MNWSSQLRTRSHGRVLNDVDRMSYQILSAIQRLPGILAASRAVDIRCANSQNPTRHGDYENTWPVPNLEEHLQSRQSGVDSLYPSFSIEDHGGPGESNLLQQPSPVQLNVWSSNSTLCSLQLCLP